MSILKDLARNLGLTNITQVKKKYATGCKKKNDEEKKSKIEIFVFLFFLFYIL